MSLLFGVALLARQAEAQSVPVGPLVEISRPNAVGSCETGFKAVGTWSTNPGLPTDRWLVQCDPSSTNPATNPACWGNEVRLTNSSFNMEAMLQVFGQFWSGDYFGVAAAGNGFVSTFTEPDNKNVTSIFARRVGP